MRVLGRKDMLVKAKRLFERGDVDDAACLLLEERKLAGDANDAHRLSEIDELVTEMRQRLAGDARLPAFDAHLSGHETPPEETTTTVEIVAEEEEVDVTPLSLGIALVGAGVTLLAVFLPQFESNTFAQIEKNSLIQNGGGWWFIIVSVLAAGAAYRAYQRRKRTLGPVAFGLVAIGLAIFYGAAHSQRRLCSAGSSPLFGSSCTLGTPGIGIYAAGVGGLLMVIGGWQIFRARVIEWEEDEEQVSDAEARKPPTIADRLRTLDQLRSDGLITDAEHAKRRAALIEQV